MPAVFGFLKRNSVTIGMIATSFVIAGVLGAYFVSQSFSRLQAEAQNHFRLEINSITAHAVEKYRGGVTMLRALQGFFAGSEKVTRKEFYDFIRTSGFFNAYRGFSSIAYVRRIPDAQKKSFLADVRSDVSVRQGGYPTYAVSPAGTRPEYWPIVYIDPESQLMFLLGSDQSVDAVRGENITRARDIGDVSLSSVVTLKQGGLGALIAAPLYRGGVVPDAIADRQRLFTGAVTMAFTLDDFFNDVFSPYGLESQNVGIVVTGRSGVSLSLVTAAVPEDFLARLFGMMSSTRTLTVDANHVELAFTAPAKNYLTAQEQLEPFELALIFLAAAIFMSAVIIFFQRIKLISDLKNQYEFIATLSHQLRTPLSDLRWQLETRDAPREEVRRQLMSSVLVLNSIVSRMLLYIEITKGVAISKRAVAAEQLYDALLRAVATMRDASRVERLGEKPIMKNVSVDEQQIVTALMYIIENALTYSPADMKVSVTLKAEGGSLVITIADRGYGIPKKEQWKVFSSFFRATNALLGVNYGSGVSIFIAKKIIEAHGGTVKFVSKENEGTVFTITLPTA